MTPENESLRDAVERLEQQQREILDRLADLESRLPRRSKPKLERHNQPHQHPAAIETRMGMTWVNRAGVVTLVLGAAFFFKYAVESGWIGPAARVLIGAICGLAGLAMGGREWRRGRQVWGQGVSAAGIGILYLAFYAAFGLYYIIGQAPAFLLLSLVTAAAALLAMRYAAPALAALALFGGYVTPLLLGHQWTWFVLGYALLLNAGAVYLAARRGWRVLALLAVAGATAVYAAELPVPPGMASGYALFVLAWYALFYLVPARWVLAPAQGLASLAAAGIWTDSAAAFFAMTLAVAVAGLRRWPIAALASFWAAYGVWYVNGTRSPLQVFALLTAAFLLFFAWGRGLLFAAANAGLYFASGYALLVSGHDAYLGLFTVLLAALHLGMAWREPRLAQLNAGIAAVLLVLAAPIQFHGYRVTQVWALEGAALAWIAARRNDRRALYGALAVFALAMLRLQFVDSWTAVGMVLVNPRFFTFVVAAASMWAAAWWAREGWPALAEYIAGHFAMLWGLSLEVTLWAERTAAPGDLRSVQSASLSILMAAYALLLVALGFATPLAVNRLLGLGLIGVVVLKLYLYDVWYLGLFYRMAAFAVLGALLLAMSYLYSRGRAR